MDGFEGEQGGSPETPNRRPSPPAITIITDVTPSTSASSNSTERASSRGQLPPKITIPSVIQNNRAPVILAIPHSPVLETTPSNNLLGVPAEQRHLRSHSLSSVASGASGWTATPYTSTPASDIGDEDIDVRHLLDTNGNEGNDEAKPTPFAFTVKQLQELHDPKNLDVLRAMGGIKGLSMGLRTDVKKGLPSSETVLDGSITLEEIYRVLENDPEEQYPQNNEAVQATTSVRENSSGDQVTSPTIQSSNSRKQSLLPKISSKRTQSFPDRKRVFGINKVPPRKSKSILLLMWLVLQDRTLILLSVAAVVSLSLGLYQTFRPGSPNKLEWIEGVAILTAVAIATVAQSLNDYQTERQFRKLNKKKEGRNIKVVRGGRPVLISIYDVVVGDILLLEPGDVVPVDVVLAEGHNVRCDESSITGESGSIRKVPADFALERTAPGFPFTGRFDPYILSGSKVEEGVGRGIVTAVGPNSCYGKTLMAFNEEVEDTPLQVKLNRIADMIAKWGSSVAGILFLVLFIKFLVRLPSSNQSAGQNAEHFMQILIVAVSVVVVAVPEGLPLAVTLSLAYATVRMLKDNNLVRVLKACETMGNATTICCDKTGTLTENKMTVVVGLFGVSETFVREREVHNGAVVPVLQVEGHNVGDDDGVPMREFFGGLNEGLRTLIRESTAVNASVFEGTDDQGNRTMIGSKTETALVTMAKDYLGLEDIVLERDTVDVIQPIPFSSERKWMATVVKAQLEGATVYRLLVKGAPEIVLPQCSQVVSRGDDEYLTHTLSSDDRHTIDGVAADYATRALRTMALAYRDFQIWPPKGARVVNHETLEVQTDDLFNHLTFISILGIQDPLRRGVKKAVDDCHRAGVFVRMVTGDNHLTAKAIAEECGILTPGGILMEGPRFRKLSQNQLDLVVPRLQVLARSSPEDKRRLVVHLKKLGEIVAVTGDGTNDAPALKSADVGFSMGIAGTEVAKEASSIILMDDNFASIVNAIAWGRCVNDAVKKFLQFQLTVSVTAVGLTVSTSVASVQEDPIVTAVQLLWVNLIQDTLGALALATDPPTKALLDRQPDAKGASMISFNMWKMIFGQSILQLAVTVTLAFAGPKLFPNWSSDILSTLVFNTFVWLQFFNEINCRRIDNRLNVFEGVHKNGLFILIMVVIVVCQIIIINFGGAAFSVTRLDGLQWLISVLLGLLTIPWGVALRLLPNQYIEYLIPSYFYRRRRRVLFDEESQPTNWNATVEVIRDDLLVIKRLRNRHRLGTLGTRGREIQPQAVRPHTPYDPPLSPIPVDDRPGLLVTPASSIVSSPSSSSGRLYSVFNASALVPALMASSITIPVSIHHEEEDPPVPNAAELGIEIYHKTRGHGGVRSSPEARLGSSQSAAQSQL